MQIRLYFLPASLDSQECKTTVASWIQIQAQSKFVAGSVHKQWLITVQYVYFGINADLLSCGNI